jgi:hypothetical protein
MSTPKRNFSERDYNKIFKGRPAHIKGNKYQPWDPIAPTGERWIIPKKHALINEILTNMFNDKENTTLRDAFIKAFLAIVTSGIGVDIKWDNYDIVFITSEPSKARVRTQQSNDLGCYKWGYFVRNYGWGNELPELDLTLTITPVVKKAPQLPPLDNETLLVNQKKIIDQMTAKNLFANTRNPPVGYPAVDLDTNVLYLDHDNYYVFNTCLGVFDPYHDFGKNPPWRSGPIVDNLNGTKRDWNQKMNAEDNLKNRVKNLLQTQYDKLKKEYDDLGKGKGDVFGNGGILKKIWDHQGDIEQTMLNELMPLSNKDENTYALSLYESAKTKLDELQDKRKPDDDPLRMSHINAPSYPKYDAPTEMFDSTFNNSCKFIVASAIDGASCGACGNLNKLLRGCPMEIGNINITFMRLHSGNNPDQGNCVNFCSYMTNEDRDGVYFHLRITRKVTIIPQGEKPYTAYYKYKLMDNANDASKLTVVTVDSELGCYRDRSPPFAVYSDFMKINHMLPGEPGKNEPTFGENVYDFHNRNLDTDEFDWVHGVRKACCDFLFSLPTFLKNGGYINILSSENVISPNLANPVNFPVCVSSGDQPATALAHFILKNCIEKKDKKNVNEFLHEYFATNNENLRYGNRHGTCISAVKSVKRSRTDEDVQQWKRKKKGGGNRPYIGSSWGRVPRFDAKIDTQFKKIKAFFEGCAQFKYPVILLICYNEVKTDSDTLDNFLKYTVRDLGHFEYEAKTGFVDDEKLKEDIKRLVRTMPQEEKSPNAYEKIIKTYNAVRSPAEAEDDDGGGGGGSSVSGSSDSSATTVQRLDISKSMVGSSTRNHRRTQYTNKHKRSSKSAKTTIKHRKSYRKHNRTINRRKSRRHR